MIERYLKHWGIADGCIEKVPALLEKAAQLSALAEKKQKGYFLFGPQGRGKTTLATAMLIYELARFFKKQSPYRSIQFVFVPDLLIELHSCFAPGSAKIAGDVIYRVAEYDYLVLDGLGEGGRPTPFVIGALGTIIHYREANRLKKRTMITSNFSLNVIGEELDGRISSRISGMCEDYEFDGEDRRKKR